MLTSSGANSIIRSMIRSAVFGSRRCLSRISARAAKDSGCPGAGWKAGSNCFVRRSKPVSAARTSSASSNCPICAAVAANIRSTRRVSSFASPSGRRWRIMARCSFAERIESASPMRARRFASFSRRSSASGALRTATSRAATVAPTTRGVALPASTRRRRSSAYSRCRGVSSGRRATYRLRRRIASSSFPSSIWRLA